MSRALYQEGILPFEYVVEDCLSGHSADFLDAVESCARLTYLVAIPADTRCWLHGPVMEDKHYRYQGETRTKRTVAPKDSTPLTVVAIAKSLHHTFWYQRTVSEGAKGATAYDSTKRLMTLCRNELHYRAVWLVMKRTLEEQPSYWYYISNAPLSTRLPTFVWLSGVRWAIEQCYEESKTELGMDHYEVCQYPEWHHHMWICMLAHFCVWHVNIRLGGKSPGLDPVPEADATGSRLTIAPMCD